MRVLTIVSDLAPGGTQRVARNFALAYKSHGAESALLAYGGGGALERSLHDGGVEVMVGSAAEVAQRDAFRRALAWMPDAVHMHRPGLANKTTGAMLHAVKAAVRRGTKAAVGVLETNVFGRVDHSPDSSCIDVHLQLSKWCLWRWQRWARFHPLRPLSVVVPNLVLHEEFPRGAMAVRAAFRREHGIPQDALVFGRVGSPIISKWSSVMFEAFQLYALGNPRAWLVLVGMPARFQADLDSMPDAVRRRITLIDFLHADALTGAYSAMDVFLHASQIGESFGMVLAEALLCGAAVITLSTPAKDNSQLEVVGHERGGLVVASASGMVEAMHRLEDGNLRALYSARGADCIKRQFGPATLMPQVLELAALSAQGYSRTELRRRVLQIPGITTAVSTAEIGALLRGCIGDYRRLDLALMQLVSNPLLYRAYLAMTHKTK